MDGARSAEGEWCLPMHELWPDGSNSAKAAPRLKATGLSATEIESDTEGTRE
jgi:hypothetical protein